MSEWTDIQTYAGKQLKKLEGKLRDVRSSGDVEAVHQVRVTSRRLEEPVFLCRPWVKDKQIDGVTKPLKRLRRAFTAVRDLDVLQMSLASVPAETFGPAGLEHLEAKLSTRRATRLRKAEKECSHFDSEELQRAIDKVLETAQDAAGASCGWVSARLHEWIAERAADVLNSTGDGQSTADLHRIRIGLKKVRYSLELQAAIKARQNEELIARFKQVQDLLGDWNDQLQAADRLSRYARKRNNLIGRPEWSAALLGHAAQRVRRSQEIAGEFLGQWPGFKKVIADLATGCPDAAAQVRPENS